MVGTQTWTTVILLNGLLGNEQKSFFIFEIVPKYCISDFFVNSDGYSISSKGFLPTVVDIMVI